METDSKELSLAHERHQELVNTILTAKRSAVYMGQLLHDIRENERYLLAVGEGIDSWVDYLSQPEIGLSKGEADRLIQIYERFVLWLGLSIDDLESVPIKNLHYLLPIAKNTDDREMVSELIDDARALSQKDFRERIYDIKSDGSGDRTYEYLVMRKCRETGSMNKVHGIESDFIKETFNIQEDDLSN